MTLVDQNIQADNAGCSFENIADDFGEHVHRSVPLYDEGHELICTLSDFFLPPGATVTELGTATGALAEKFLRHNERCTDLSYIGIDRVEGMLECARIRCGGRASIVQDRGYRDWSPGQEHDDYLLLYYTMQFVNPRSRQDLFTKVYEALEWGGAFVLFEKVRASDARFQDIMAQLYIEFKLHQQFNEVEILGKQRSLKGIQEPFSTQGNLDLMKRARFVDMMTIMKSISFEGFLAIK